VGVAAEVLMWKSLAIVFFSVFRSCPEYATKSQTPANNSTHTIASHSFSIVLRSVSPPSPLY
jgi:hypothetical protein